MKRRALIVVGCVAMAASATTQQDIPQNDSIRADELRADLLFLASDHMRGRLTNTPENRLAADFIRSRFERLGLTPPGPDGSFFHPYRLDVATLATGNQLTLYRDGSEEPFRSGADFYPLRFSPSMRARGPLAFVGFGITAPAFGHDDYRAADVRGNIVLALDHEPAENDPTSAFDGVMASEYTNPLRKALAAQEHGATGILIVSDVQNHARSSFDGSAGSYWPASPPRMDRYLLTDWVERVRIPAAQISEATADSLLRGTGHSLNELAKGAERAQASMVPVPGSEVELVADVSRRTITDRNVIAKLDGADPALRQECVIICAHFDHEGADGDHIFNGADDDGSGTVGVLEIAEAYALAAKAGRRPRRSLLFAAWNSEERGLLGAWAYTEHPLVPLDRTVAVLNMDMIGRNEEVPADGGARFRGLEPQTAASNANAVNLLGYTRTRDLVPVLQKANGPTGLELKLRYDRNASSLLRRSDHWPFLQRGVPAAWIFTGLHPDYHTASDDPDRINYPKLERVVRLVHRASWVLADQQERPRMATDGR